jgi:ABC-type multidrug transport system ATPase subunit
MKGKTMDISNTIHFFYRGPSRALEKRIAETLDLAGLTDKADRPIKGFSGRKP